MLIISHHDIKFAITAFESLNPFSYSHLKHRNFMEATSYLFSLVFICMFILSLSYLPVFYNLDGKIESELEKMERLGISYDISAEKPIDVSLFGIQGLHIGNENADSMVSVSGEGILSKSVFCFAFSPFCRISSGSSISSEDMKDLSEKKKEVSEFLRNIMILSLPGIFFTILIFYSLKFLILAVLFSLLGLLISKVFRFELNLYSSFAVSCYSMTALVVPRMLAGNFGIGLFGVEWFVFLALFISGLMFSSKKIEGDTHGSRRSAENK